MVIGITKDRFLRDPSLLGGRVHAEKSSSCERMEFRNSSIAIFRVAANRAAPIPPFCLGIVYHTTDRAPFGNQYGHMNSQIFMIRNGKYMISIRSSREIKQYYVQISVSGEFPEKKIYI